MSNENLKHFETLNKIDVSEKIEKKKSGSVELSYLSWAWAWGELKKKYPCAIYEVQKFNGLPYVFDPLTGYMVYTKITIENITHEMWLPVMDGANKAMKDKPYTYLVQKKEWSKQYNKFIVVKNKDGNILYDEKTVETATMFDINKTIMRCLVKNIAMFGLGLYIFAGEDLPEDAEHDKQEKAEKKETKIDFESYKQKLLSSKDIDELQSNFKSCYTRKIEFTEVEYAELVNIKDTMKNDLSKE